MQISNSETGAFERIEQIRVNGLTGIGGLPRIAADRLHTVALAIVGVLALALVTPLAADTHRPSGAGTAADLPLPTSMPLQDYERVLYRWVLERRYAALGWRRDKGVRDTGPFIEEQYYGVHPAVRMYYSPEVLLWLQNDRQGDIPDGAIIIKEMFKPPAALYQDLVNNPRYADPNDYEALIARLIGSWTIMVRDKAGSTDGWFWASPGPAREGEDIATAIKRQLDTLESAPASAFGAPCLRCHASAASEFTFSTLRNISGFLPEEEPVRYLVDTSWRSAKHFSSYPLSVLADDPYVKSHYMLPATLRPFMPPAAPPADQDNASHMEAQRAATKYVGNPESLADPNPLFVDTFSEIRRVRKKNVLRFPSQWTDQVLPGPHGVEEYITSDNCFGCHGGLGGEPYGVTMFIQTGPEYGDGYNVSEYGEWRWSPMGLAGRDPIFHAQLESEMAYLARDDRLKPSPLVGTLEQNEHAVTNTCLSCHGAMGQRQLMIDAATDSSLDPNMSVDYFYLTEKLSSDDKTAHDAKYLKYGKLAREGISCAVCHHIDKPAAADVAAWNPPPGWLAGDADKELAYSLFHHSTGQYVRGPADEFFGPFADVAVIPMKNTLGAKPVHNAYIADSQLCGTCHTINLPNIGATHDEFPVLDAAETNPALRGYPHSIEQATFLEWQNSAFARDPDAAGSQFASCQDCHMPGGFESLDKSVTVDQIVTRIAAIQDATFPETENRLPVSEIDIPLRDDYRRHEHVGLNVFLLEMFDQFPEILGVSKADYMTGAKNGVDAAIENMVRQAQRSTAEIEVDVLGVEGRNLKTRVTLRNRTGHRFPSGVAFRRAFVEFLVLDGKDVVWGSGRTNGIGVILDGRLKPLPTEFLPNADAYQPHHQTITQEDQVQIYEELNQNAQQQFTTSFIHRVYDIKDNRLLPDGWRAADVFKDQGELLFEYFEATDPHGVGDDPDYRDQGPGFRGGDSVVYDVTLPDSANPDNLKVQATLYYQAIPPSWLKQRFEAAPRGAATRRLYYLASHLDLSGTPMKNWKLELVSDSAPVRQSIAVSSSITDADD